MNRFSTFERTENTQPEANGILTLPLVFLPATVVLPQVVTPLTVMDERNRAACEHAISKQQTIAVAMQHKPDNHLPFAEQFQRIGTETALTMLSNRDNTMIVLGQGRRRIEIMEVVQETPFAIVRARIVATNTDAEDEIKAELDIIRQGFEQVIQMEDHLSDDVIDHIQAVTDPIVLCDLITATLSLTADQRQDILAEPDLLRRLVLLEGYIADHLRDLEIRDDLNQQVQQEMARVQREAYLREQMRVIQTELGEEDPFQQEMNELREQIEVARMPSEVRDKALIEFKRLSMMAPMSPEATVSRTYIDWLIDVPWHKRSRDNLSLSNAEQTLERDHYGLEKVKERILEHIAVRKLARNKSSSPILCFVGPPGVGKTSMGETIANALGRQFVRMSLGGVRDEAEIRGHRRTYIGSLPGRIIQTMKRAGTINPVFMLDEIDKMSADYRGDPASALLEVLDPEQNKEFVDHYLEVPYDLSNVLFITTANELYPLPEALEDRMEIIEFRAYTEEEKLEIARRFLIPKQLEKHGLSRYGIHFQNDALETVVRQYTLEAGVRNLEREIANVCRKIARLVATQKNYPKRITASLTERFLGPPQILLPHINREDSVGLVTGLVWTPGGGDTQIIEIALLPGKGSLTLTGQLGDVLQESAQTALGYMRYCAQEFDIPYEDFENFDIHIHMPEGAVPKDGPSAGITLATGIISVFTEAKVRSDIAMTGEVTLRGRVLPVGGVKEKVLAAHRYRIPNVILPAGNAKDLVDVPKQALKNLNIIFVEHMRDVLDTVLLDIPEQRQRDLIPKTGNHEDGGEASPDDDIIYDQ